MPQRVGASLPIVVTLDLHGHITQRMVDLSSALVRRPFLSLLLASHMCLFGYVPFRAIYVPFMSPFFSSHFRGSSVATFGHVPRLHIFDCHQPLTQLARCCHSCVCSEQVIYKTYPHIDNRSRAIEAVRIIADTIEGKITPVRPRQPYHIIVH